MDTEYTSKKWVILRADDLFNRHYYYDSKSEAEAAAAQKVQRSGIAWDVYTLYGTFSPQQPPVTFTPASKEEE